MPRKTVQHIIVLKEKQERDKVLKVLEKEKGKVLHDSGERIIIVEVPEINKMEERLPSTIKPLKLKESNRIKSEISQLSQHELLFIDALILRSSEKFINEKKLRKPGSTKEEKKMLEGSDFLGDDMEMNDF